MSINEFAGLLFAIVFIAGLLYHMYQTVKAKAEKKLEGRE